MRDNGQPLGLPPFPLEDQPVIRAFHDCGMARGGAMGGLEGLPWESVLAFAQGTLTVEPGDDVLAIYHMSAGYAHCVMAGAHALAMQPVDWPEYAAG